MTASMTCEGCGAPLTGRARCWCSRACQLEHRSLKARGLRGPARTHRVTVWVEPDLLKAFEEAAQRAGMRVCDWAREVLTDTVGLERAS